MCRKDKYELQFQLKTAQLLHVMILHCDSVPSNLGTFSCLVYSTFVNQMAAVIWKMCIQNVFSVKNELKNKWEQL